MASRFNWYGGRVKARTLIATRLAIDQTTAAMVEDAKTSHSFRNVTGTLEGSIQMRPAVLRGMRWIGQFGSWSVNYAIFVELGTRRMAARPYLRPAFDREAPKLAGRIRALR